MKQNPICAVYRRHLQHKGIERFNMKGWKKIKGIPCKTVKEKTGILMSDYVILCYTNVMLCYKQKVLLEIKKDTLL